MPEMKACLSAFVENWHVWLVSVVLVVAAVIDGWKLKVPNWITFPLVIGGWVYSAACFGWPGLGWSLFGVIWGLAILGILFQAAFISRFKIFSVLTYLAMGWMVVATLVPLVRALSLAGVVWLAAGGLCYTLGVIFYAWKSLKFAHAIWHLFVLAGSLCHFFGIFFFVAN